MSINANANIELLSSGPWVRYVPDGEWGASLDVYDFYPNGHYRVIVGILPKNRSMETPPTGLSINGNYIIRDDTILLKEKDGGENNRKFEIHGECLFLKGDNNDILILRRVSSK